MDYLKYVYNSHLIFSGFSAALTAIIWSYSSADFKKKTQETPYNEIERALKIMNEYYNDKNSDK